MKADRRLSVPAGGRKEDVLFEVAVLLRVQANRRRAVDNFLLMVVFFLTVTLSEKNKRRSVSSLKLV